jgi:P-type conjugative transfer ATPase TrbB
MVVGLQGEGGTEGGKRLRDSIKRDFGPEVMRALENPKIIEIMLNSSGRIWFDEFGKGMYPTDVVYEPHRSNRLMSLIASTMDTVIVPESPILEGELPLDGSRFAGIISPIVSTPIFAIRKPAQTIYTLEQYATDGVLTNKSDPLNARRRARLNFVEACRDKDHLEIIKLAIKNRLTMLVIGGTGSGKTTLVNGVIEMMTRLTRDRLVLIEDTREIQCKAENSVILRSSEHVDMMRLLRVTLRLRPDRIIVGEVRGAEALALLTAWNTGHPGGVATIHADSALDGLYRLERMMQQAGVPADPWVIASAVNLVVFIDREESVPAGRKVREIAYIKGLDEEAKRYQLQYL